MPARHIPRLPLLQLLVLLGAVALPLGGCASGGSRADGGRAHPLRLELLGEARIPSLDSDGARLGGLSGLTWVAADDFLAVSDDKAEFGPARYYHLRIRPEGVPGRAGRRILVEVAGWTAVGGARGGRLDSSLADLEAIAALPGGEVLVASEGWGERGIAPFLARLGPDGGWREELPLPEGFLPTADGRRGVRPNLAFESAAATADGRYLFVATENALAQDGPRSDAGISSPSRLLRYDLAERRWDAQWLYPVEPPRFRPAPGAARVAGLVELEAIDSTRLLALERSFEPGRGYDVRLFLVTFDGAEEVSGRASLAAGRPPRPLRKRLLLDLTRLGIRLDNLEGMALGRALPDGRRLLVLAADDNYKRGLQVNQVLVFALSGVAAP